MQIKEISQILGLNKKTIRYYEDAGLIIPARSTNSYREYSTQDVHRLRFVQRARGLGFTISECRQLLMLYDNKIRASADVKAMALAKIQEINEKIFEMQSLGTTLQKLANTCQGDDRPDCPILDDFTRLRG